MEGYNKQSKNYSNKISPSFSFSSLFKQRRMTTRRVDDDRDDFMAPTKIWTSDYDKGRYVADPGIDRRADDFIKKVHMSCSMEHEPPTIAAA
ncbi:G-patch domain-containing protein [Psidium guajava]|nr:G-patch domain-containing protein [Psidium guajava]